MDALQALGAAVGDTGLDPRLVELVCLRASQINGCSVCVDGHPRIARKLGETDERLFAVSAWRDAPYFSEAERAALALTEAMTRLADREDPVPDSMWSAASAHYDDKQLAGLVLAIANINVWNRLNAATRQIAGNWKP
jgi:AhpD family alkylhydroperoxidase